MWHCAPLHCRCTDKYPRGAEIKKYNTNFAELHMTFVSKRKDNCSRGTDITKKVTQHLESKLSKRRLGEGYAQEYLTVAIEPLCCVAAKVLVETLISKTIE